MNLNPSGSFEGGAASRRRSDSRLYGRYLHADRLSPANEQETFYYDPTTGERVTATYLVTLVVPSNYFGQIEVEAQSEQEAGRLAVDRAHEIDWEYCRLRLHESEIEVLEVECDNPPEGALLSRPGSSEADISAHFEDAVRQIPRPGNSAPTESQDGGAANGGDGCN